MLTIEQCKNLRPGQELYSGAGCYSRTSYASALFSRLPRTKEPRHVKVTSVKTWKTRPNDVRVRWQYGLYTHGEFSCDDRGCHDENDFWLTAEEAIASYE